MQVRDHSLRNPGLGLHWQEVQKMILERHAKAKLCGVSNAVLRNLGLSPLSGENPEAAFTPRAAVWKQSFASSLERVVEGGVACYKAPTTVQAVGLRA